MLRNRFAALALAALCACTAGPDYRVPEKALVNLADANGPFSSAQDSAFTPEPLPERWWSLYDDPRLNSFVLEALAANASLRAADANLTRASYVVREAQAARFPVTTLSGTAGITRSPLETEALPGTATYELGGNIAYPLDLAGGIRRSIEAAGYSADAIRAVRDQIRTTVVAAVTRSYVGACAAGQTLASARNVLDIEQSTLNATQRLFRGGRNTAFDVTRAQAAVDQSAAAIPPILAARKAAVYELTALLGRPASAYPKDMENCDQPPRLVRLLPVGDGAQLLKRRADIREAERSLAAATAGIGVATSQLYPQVSIGGSLGLGGLDSSFGNKRQYSFNIGPLLTWTFPNVSVSRALIGQAGAGADAAAATFDATVIEALRQTETALDDYVREIDHHLALTRARDSAARAADQAGRLFRFGRTDFLNVLNAQANLATAQSTLATSSATLLDKQVSLFLALGGGWEAQAE